MASDWTKMRHHLDLDPHVLRMAEILQVDDIDILIGKLWRLWSHADEHTTDGLIRFAADSTIDRLVRMQGFCGAMIAVGWLEMRPEGALIVRFNEHNVRTAKLRAQNAKANSRFRQRQIISSSRDDAASREHHDRDDASSRGHHLHNTTQHNTGDESPDTPLGRRRADPSAGPADEVVLTFPTDGKTKEWVLRQSKVAELAAAFPALDVPAEAKKALAWVQQHPDRRKTARGMPRFLYGWLSRSQDRAPSRSPPPTFEEKLRSAFERNGLDKECPS